MEVQSRHASQVLSVGLLPLRSWAKLITAGMLLLGTLAATLLTSAEAFMQEDGSDVLVHPHLRSTSPSSSHDSNSISYDDYDIMFSRSLQDGNLTGCTLDCCNQFEETICGAEETSFTTKLPFALQIILIIVLLCMSALFSGLTLGLMSLDKTGLEIVMAGDDPVDAEYAKRIYPVRAKGNLLLCTLLLGNVAVNALLSIILADFAGGTVGFVSSTFLIVIFGEILPQAFCSRYALRIGSATIPIVLVIRFLVWPIAAPLAFVLDKALGRELASTYSNAEMLKLLQIHVQENVMDAETAGAMKGALTYKNTSVKEVMTPIERTFMLNVDEKLNFETVARIFRTGYSRIPVFEISQNNVIGLLFVKDLIFVDPEDGTPVRSFVQIFGRGVHVVWPDDKLGDVLAELKQGRSHLALVRDVNNEDDTQDPFYEVKGIITLEDIIEKIIGDKIVDETDAFVDNSQRIKVDRGESFEWARLRLLDAKIVDEMLSYSEARAVCAHLRMNHTDAVKWLTDTQLERLVSETSVSNLPTATRELGKGLPNELMYEKGVNSHVCTLILGGKITILVGNDNFRSDISSWALLATKALMDPLYVPDFTAYVSDGPSRCLCFTHEAFAAAVDASAVERRSEASSPHVGSPTLSEPSLSDASIDPTAVAGNTADHPSRRDKLIAALHPFRKDVSLSHGTESVKPKEEAAPTPRQSVVRFEGGGIMHTPSTRSMPKLNLQSDVDELSDSMRTEPSSSVATESEAAVGVPPTIHEEPDHSDSALPEVAQDAGDPKENRPSSPPPPEEK